MAQDEINNGSREESRQGAGDENRLGQNKVDPHESSAEVAVGEQSPRKGGGTRLLFILLIVVAICAVGLYLLGQNFVSTASQVISVEPHNSIKIKVPERAGVSPAEGVTEEVIPSEKVAVVESAPVIVKAEAMTPVEPPKGEIKSAFVLTSGGYLYATELDKAISQIEKMGLEITQSSQPEGHHMTRLLVGRYPLSLAKKRLAEIKPRAEGAFMIAEKGKFAVYAGSFLLLDKARVQADYLYQDGVRTVETAVNVDLPSTTLKFGSFETREAALRIAAELKDLGVMDPQVASKN